MTDDDIAAGIVLVSRFCVSHSEQFQGYIDYINRDEAIRTEHFSDFSLYNDYMDDPEKTTALFTCDNDRLSSEQKNGLKNLFQRAQASGSLMWQNVISFDNRFLSRYGFYNSDTGELNEDKMRELTRAAMSEMADKEKMSDTMIWSAAIHFNTDNIHIHIAAVESTPTREIISGGAYAGQQRGKLKQSTLDDMKTAVFQTMFDRQLEHKQITDIVRKDLVGGINSAVLCDDRTMRRQMNRILSLLPANKASWKYNAKQVRGVQPEIDKLTDMYIRRYHRKDFSQLIEKISEEQQLLSQAYGQDSEKATGYTDRRMRDMYTRMGNTILLQMKSLDAAPKGFEQQPAGKKGVPRKQKNNLYKNSSDLYALKRALKKDWDSIKNQQYFAQLQREIEGSVSKEESI